MIYIVIALIIVPMAFIFAFLMAILIYQKTSQKGSLEINLKVLKLMNISIHTKTERTTHNKRKNK